MNFDKFKKKFNSKCEKCVHEYCSLCDEHKKYQAKDFLSLVYNVDDFKISQIMNIINKG